MVGSRPLPRLSVSIHARRELVFQLIAAVGQGPDAAHARVLERPAADRLIVEFTTRVLGRTVKTLEEVGLHPPDRISYRLLRGPLPDVEEEFRLEPHEPGVVLSYSGTYQPNRGWLRALFDQMVVPPLYRRAVRQSMEQIKRAAEERQRKSRVFPAG